MSDDLPGEGPGHRQAAADGTEEPAARPLLAVVTEFDMTKTLPVPFTSLGLFASDQLTTTLAQMLGSWGGVLSRSLALNIVRPLPAGIGPLISPGIVSRLQEMLPPNWPDDPDWDAALAIMNDGIPLIWVPREAIVVRLMEAGTAGDRRQVLAGARADVAADCAAAMAEVTAPGLVSLAELVAAAGRALGGGHCEAAQALAANVFDRWLRDVAGRGVLFTPPGKGRSPYDHVRGLIEPVSGEVTLRDLMALGALAPVLMALAHFRPGNPVPEQFGRHATAHVAGPEQYTGVNAAIAVMLTASVLRQAQASGW